MDSKDIFYFKILSHAFNENITLSHGNKSRTGKIYYLIKIITLSGQGLTIVAGPVIFTLSWKFLNFWAVLISSSTHCLTGAYFVGNMYENVDIANLPHYIYN